MEKTTKIMSFVGAFRLLWFLENLSHLNMHRCLVDVWLMVEHCDRGDRLYQCDEGSCGSTLFAAMH